MIFRRLFGHVKANPSVYIIHFRNGKPVRQGAGLSFFYFAPNASLVSIPLETIDIPFMFQEVSQDFQEVTVQGQVTYRISEPVVLAGMMNFTLGPDRKAYLSEDPQKLSARVVTVVQVQVRNALQTMPLQDLLRRSSELEISVRDAVGQAATFKTLGISLVDLSILAVKPNPDTGRALEANAREQILKQADDAVYVRRNAAIEQERAVKENELNTEIAIETKKRQIRDTQLEAERAELERRQEIEDQALTGKINLEERNRELTVLRLENARKEADAKAYAISTTMAVFKDVDPKVLQALTIGQAKSSTLIAQAFNGLAEGADRIGELNISPALLRSLLEDQED
ncbi:SPFH domain-containing protein [Arboricoccus pini]|nr:SPFH domain-containing protein [Arboricoccus pini]